MKNTPLDFQMSTVKHVMSLFQNNQRRVLVADEAGLGKTTVAAEVARQVKSLPGILDDQIYCIVYVCCNLQIARQNIDTLSDQGEQIDLSESRLSMQHYVFYRKKKEILENKGDTLILSLTPATSFQLTKGAGSAKERALIYACLTLLPEYQAVNDELSALMSFWAHKAWPELSSYYYVNVHDQTTKEYQDIIHNSLPGYLQQKYISGRSIHDEILHLCSDPKYVDSSEAFYLISRLRKIFAHLSLDVMHPDLVIMDEFQKFSSLINIDQDEEHETEENLVARKFFSNKDTYILLLSATPYKPFTTSEEINENNNDEQYRDFNHLMKFLYENSKNEFNFNVIWRDYSHAIHHLTSENFRSVLDKQIPAEDMLYHVMGRTERINKGIISPITEDISQYLTEGDIRSYLQMQHVVDLCRQSGVKVFSAPIDYTKSSAYQLSFMDNYKLKESIARVWKSLPLKPRDIDHLLLNSKDIENYQLSNYHNARLNYIAQSIFGTWRKPTHVEQLLWIPASHPYYKQPDNVFTRNQDFSKYLVFSAWGMVPKMLACLLSYESEMRLYKPAYKNAVYDEKDKKQSPLLTDVGNTKRLSLLCTVSDYLADLYNPEAYFGWKIDDIKKSIHQAISKRIESYHAQTTNRASSLILYQLLLSLDHATVDLEAIPSNAAEVLTNIAIGSPAICLYRIFKRVYKGDNNNARKAAERVAREMASIFNNRYGIAAVRCATRTQDNHYERVFEYCIMGNLQSVLDEFVHMIGEDKTPEVIEGRLVESFIQAFPQKVNTTKSFDKQDDRFFMRKHFAVDFGTGTQSEKDVNRSVNVRTAFNSPFRPFVLASTSVGQEGLDFHWYCRKIVHWNLPSNPQDIEQREGRVNRYKCLSVRRNVAKIYPDIFGWKEMFSNAAKDLKQDYPDLVPFWYLPPLTNESKDSDKERIERIVPMYPMSGDELRYHRLIKTLTLYRLTMGQPRQEDLLKLLEGKLSEDEITELLFDLCPFNREQ